ncbi:hypothetical protein AM587_10002216 [Phytophthora nicotianae]|uniref:Uncharacterized protein n=1 Tax=Phytophthora nicotianae TaxID=4792 RepID=A0A0W8CMH6_PHYNI|nr:hypothetical protein AM587_10006163 [Phytophthora nicotianae]KUF85148.1 hypothetical protein AM587_10002216 [Phytophthora nicotianae]
MASKGNEKEIDYVSKQANLTAQIESERQAAKKWWDEYGMCYLENARPEDFTYDNRVLALKKKLDDPNIAYNKHRLWMQTAVQGMQKEDMNL